MPQPKTAPRKKAATSKVAAARAEKAPTLRTVDFRGLTLTLPAELPGTLFFDLAELDTDSASLGAQMRLLSGLIGPEQVQQVRDKVAEDRISFEDVAGVVIALVDDVLSAFGLGEAGEPSASPGS